MRAKAYRKNILFLFLVAWLSYLAASKSCMQAITDRNFVNQWQWTSCYQGYDKHIIGTSKHSPSSYWFGSWADLSLAYYPNVNFKKTSTQQTKWYSYHSNGNCGGDCGDAACSCTSNDFYDPYLGQFVSSIKCGSLTYYPPGGCDYVPYQYDYTENTITTDIYEPCYNELIDVNYYTTSITGVCDIACPGDFTRTYPGQYIASIADSRCTQCDLSCSVCDDTSAMCRVCIASKKLIANYAECLAAFSTGGVGTCLTNGQCLSNCPEFYYFLVPQASTNNAIYTWIASGVATLKQTDVCYLCHSNCVQCFGPSNAQCKACASTPGLIVNFDKCKLTFPQHQDLCQTDYQCVTNCPTLYYKLYNNQIDSSYDFSGYIDLTYKHITNYCFLCHKYCTVCSNRNDNTCTQCAAGYYKWNYESRCSYFCNEATYTGSNRGEFVHPVTSASTKTCVLCNVGCRFCANSASQCYKCKSTHYLLDDKLACQARFNCAICTDSTVTASGCGANDKTCVSTCPTFFYFPVLRANAALYPTFINEATATVDTTLNGYNTDTSNSRVSPSSTISPTGADSSYLYRPDTNFCRLCDALCTKCFGPTSNDCKACVNSAALIVNYNKCLATFPQNQSLCQADFKCLTDCPKPYYKLMMNVIDASYSFTGYNDVTYKNMTNICFLCHAYCLTCTDRLDTTCTQCAAGYFKWLNGTRCNYFCSQGEYSSGGQRGQFVLTPTSFDNQICSLCDVGCQFCANSASNCFKCQDSHFLLDDRSTCLSTFNCPICTDNTIITDGCAARDKLCRASTCPQFFYFKVNRTGTGSIDGSKNALYTSFARAAGATVNTWNNRYNLNNLDPLVALSSLKSPLGANISYYYRQDTNYCKLCHSLCTQCFGPTRFQCRSCVDSAALIVNKQKCVSTFPHSSDNTFCHDNFQCIDVACPPNFYFRLPRADTTNPIYSPALADYHEPTYVTITNICYLCHEYCKTCTDKYDYSCTSCAYNYYKWQNGTRCNYYCTEGQYTASGQRGQYIKYTAPTSFTNRACQLCDPGCQFCANSASQCYKCQDDYYLLDDRSTCLSTFSCSICTNTTIITDGCAARDKLCRASTCPQFFYFKVNRTGTNTTHINDGSTNQNYTFFTRETGKVVSTSLNGYNLNNADPSVSPSSLKSTQGANPSYFYRQDTNFCKLCDPLCTQCFGPSRFQCRSCVDSAALIVNKQKCMSTFPDPSDNVLCYDNFQCIDVACPTNFYFRLPRAQTTNPIYSFTGYHELTYITITNICYLCHEYCKTCTDKYDYTCTSCAYKYYKWQNGTRCNYYCTQGQYAPGAQRGQYIKYTAPSSFTNRACQLCDVGCQFCANSATQCYKCQDDYFLLDDKAACQNTFTCANCRNSSMVNGTDGCYSRDKYCRPFTCPPFYYFRVFRNATSTGFVNATKNPIYTFFTQNATVNTFLNLYSLDLANLTVTPSSLRSPQGSNLYFYRQDTNFCKLCDFRCMKCFGPSNRQCTQCINHYFLWTNDTVCSSLCPTGQYQLNISAPYPINETKCGNCDIRCIACIGYDNNCTSCKVFPNANYAFLWTHAPANLTCLNSCPVSPTPLTVKGYYGSIGSMVCYPCPDQCSNCNIDLVMNISFFPELKPIVCGSDYKCQAGIQCTSCLQGSSLVAGKCVNQYTCQLYSYFQKGNSSSAWSASNCVCLPGFYFSALINCSPCDITCKTCNGSTSSHCLTCAEGYKLSATFNCTKQNAGSQVLMNDQWDSSLAFTASLSSSNPSDIRLCGSYYTLFGYKSNVLNTSSTFVYSTGFLTSLDYYGISFKVQVLFIDNWDSQGALYFTLNSENNPSFVYKYNNYGSIGEQECGTNLDDYLMYIQGTIYFTPTTNQTNTIRVNSNVAPVSNTSGFYYYWGIKASQFTVLKCHPECASCTGPNPDQCTSCTNVNKTLINNKCICDVTRGFYFVVGSNVTCQTGCPYCNSSTNYNDCYYTDRVTATCVNPPTVNCSAPAIYADNDQINNYFGTCVERCGVGKFAVQSKMKCTSNCSTFGLYNYQGGIDMWTCMPRCPSGLIADPTTSSCVTVCPSTPVMYYWQLQNRTTDPICVTNCTTGFEFDNQNQCVTSCPAGYYTQTISNHNKCIIRCVNLFGDNVTRSCVNACPTPSYADSTTNLCVNQCPNGTYPQVRLANGNRTCVTQCELSQWLHPVFLNCSSNPLSCPVGTYADNNTKKCEPQCTVKGQVGQNSTRMCQTSCNTGFAYWDVGLCVFVCNGTMFGYVNGSRRQCVISCDPANTNTFGDVQANRTCVRNCSASPISTFGDTLTGRCVRQCPISTQYGDPYHPLRLCVPVCSTYPFQTYSFYLTKLCLPTCPSGYYGDNYTTIGVGICQDKCPSGYFADPTTNLCVARCPFRYFGLNVLAAGRPCVQVCPSGYYAINSTTNRVCTTICDNGFWADNYTRTCVNLKRNCSNQTYADTARKMCVIGTSCTTGTYADPITMGCESRCNSSTQFGDPSTNLCVTRCPTSPDYYSLNGLCTDNCTNGTFADYQANRSCVARCSISPKALYGTSAFRCVQAALCGPGLFGDNSTQLCSSCTGSLPYGDPIIRQCVTNCSLTYYGDIHQHLCVLQCNFTIGQYADNVTGLCTSLCSLGFYGVNNSFAPVCQRNCPPNTYALDTIRVCMLNCGTGYFGDPLTGKCYNSSLNCSAGYYGDGINNICVLPVNCPNVTNHYYADNLTKMCIPKCNSPNYGLNTSWVCVASCQNPFFAQNTTRTCVVSSDCGILNNNSYADSQINVCVAKCSRTPVLTFADNSTYTCVTPNNCPTNMYAENITQSCVFYCPYNDSYKSYADNYKTKYCISKCPDKYYGDFSSGIALCSPTCSSILFFRDNFTQICTTNCSSQNVTLGILDTYGDNTTGLCVTRCPSGYFAQPELSRICVLNCMANTWGNPRTRMCINDSLNCPPGTWADSFYNLCVPVCNNNPSNGQAHYGQNITKKCVPSCPSPSFAFHPTRVCIDICPFTIANSPGYFGDPGTTPTRLCVLICQTPGLYRDTANNRTCQPNCTYTQTFKTYQDPTTMTCVAECPSFPLSLYAWTNATCVEICPIGYMNDFNRSCVSSCPYLLDPTTNRCVSMCPFSSINNTLLYANLLTFTCVSAQMCPNNTYASDDLLECVSTCPNGTFIHQKNCVKFCPNGFYINPLAQTCVTARNCPTSYFANNQTHSCVLACTNGTFGDSLTKTCLTQCYGGNYSDPNTGLCSPSCSAGQIRNNLTWTCVGNCTTGLFYNPANFTCGTSCPSPYFANEQSHSCVLACTSNPMTFSSTSPVRACVTTCPASAAWFDLVNRRCTASCPNGTYQYSVNSSCVSFCPSPYFATSTACVLNCSSLYGDSTTRTCVSTCPVGYFRDPTTFLCVYTCPINPVRYYSYSFLNNRSCLTSCPSGLFADNSIGACVAECSVAPVMYGEQNTWTCVNMCPVRFNSFADPTTQKCQTTCPSTYFADNRQRKCLKNCSILFADSRAVPPACVSTCTDGTFADPLLYTCVTKCSSSFYAYTPNKTCIQSCPFGYFADSVSGYCEQRCINSLVNFADNLTRLCTASCSNNQFAHKPNGQTFGICVFTCPNTFFSDPSTMRCVSRCPNGTFGNTVNNTCNTDCYENQFKDSVNNMCRDRCPSANLLFGDPYSRTCVTSCNKTLNLFADSTLSRCVFVCSGNQFGDPVTATCVGINACTIGTISDPINKLCVTRCYNQTFAYGGTCHSPCPDGLYADQMTQTCVEANQCSSGLFGDASKRRCVGFCDSNSNGYADISTKRCLPQCNAPLFADNSSRSCVSTCPSIPLSYGLNSTRLCVQTCNSTTFGDPSLNLCVQKCSDGYFGDIVNRACVLQCPFGMYGDNTTNLCTSTCPSPYFGDPIKGICVFNCSQGLFTDVFKSRQCVAVCSSSQFSQNSTKNCVTTCLTGFSDSIRRQCMARCPSGYYGYLKECHFYQCPTDINLVFADDSRNLCVPTCPNGTFADSILRKCVRTCQPTGQYGDIANNRCLPSCTFVDLFADNTTRTCVARCPSVPSLFSSSTGFCVPQCTTPLFADNLTRTCTDTCTGGTFADNNTNTCVTQCPTKPMTYADSGSKSCVSFCSRASNRYADNATRSCVSVCSNDTFADPVSQTCKTTCPSGYFGVLENRTCQIGCLPPYFADTLSRMCVTKCPIDPYFYGDPNPSNRSCVKTCPTNAYADPITQQCVYNLSPNSTCPDTYFADPISKLCVQVCPMKSNLYANPLTKMCNSTCPPSYFADNSTMRCVLTCPSYPNYFANTLNGRCVKYCPNNTYADNSTRQCATQCPNGTFAQNSTWRCVSYCPNAPKTLRDPVLNRCVAQCSPNYFADYIRLQCVAVCPQNGNFFARNDTRQCVKTCPSPTYGYAPTRTCISKCYNGTFGDNSSRLCLSTCPRLPPLFADNFTMECTSQCTLGSYAYQATRQCVYDCPDIDFYREVSSRACVRACNITQNTFADQVVGSCVDTCSVNTYADPTTRRCVSMCPNQPMMYALNGSQTCVSICPGVLYGQNKTRSCVTTCPNDSVALPSSKVCAFQCPLGFFTYPPINTCQSTCPSPYYADPSTRTCVITCPLNQLLYADNGTRSCVSSCPSGSFSYQWSANCLRSCPIAVPPYVQTYAADYSNTCVVQCAFPFYSDDSTLRCVSNCPAAFYNDLNTHKCLPCPSVCTTCTGITSCTACISNHFLQFGSCVRSCQSLYFANPFTRTCVISNLCRPYFGINSTGVCSPSCLAGQFANTVVYRCDACPRTCLTCTSLTVCQSCISLSIFANNFCHGFCNTTNSTLMYFSSDNKTCTSSCPNGTYASIVYCRTCSPVCGNCFNTPTNCTSCPNGFYLSGNTCVTSCPALTRPNINLVCVACNTTCDAGLTYGTNVTSINGQTSIFMNFNSAINISGNLYQTFSVSTTSRRLLQSATNPGYQIIMVDSQTVQIVFPPGTTSTNFNVQIQNPQNIVDSNGNLPSSLGSSITADVNNIYSTSISSAPNDFPLYFTFLGVICVVSFLFDIELMRFMQLIYIHYFIWINLPPQFIKVFSGFKYSTLYYLPRVFQVSNAVLRPKVPSSVFNTVGDYNFLRNAGFALTPLMVIVGVWGLLKLLSLPEINRFKGARLACGSLFNDKFRYSVMMEWCHIFILNTVFFAFLQLRDYTIYDTFTQVSLIMAHIFIVLFVTISILVAYRVLKFYKNNASLAVSLRKAARLMMDDQEVDPLASTNVFNSSNKKIDITNLEYPKINNSNIFPFKCVYRYNKLSLLHPNVVYLRAILLSMIISFAPDSSIQMGLAIPLNILALFYFCKYRPFAFKFRGFRIKNYIAIYHQACLIIFEFLMLVLGVKSNNNATPAQKEQFSKIIIYYLTFACSISLIYHVFAIAVYLYRRVWLYFIQTDLFKRNFPQKFKEYQLAKKQGVKLLKTIDPKAKQYLKSLIKGYKENRSILRPTEDDKVSPNLPVRYKIKYFDRNSSASSSISRTTLTKLQRKQMISEIFNQNEEAQSNDQFEQVIQHSDNDRHFPEYEEYEEQIIIKAKDIQQYVVNGKRVLKMKKSQQDKQL